MHVKQSQSGAPRWPSPHSSANFAGGGPSSLPPAEETNVPAPMPNRYWRLFNDPGFSPPIVNPRSPMVSIEAFLCLTHQVQALARMMQTIIPHIPQLMQMLASHQLVAPWQAPQQGVPQSPLVRREQPNNKGPHRPPTKVTSDNLNASLVQPVSQEQLRQVNQRLDEVQREFDKSKEEIGESSKGGSPFIPEIQDKPVPANFRLPALESYDGSSDPSEHIMAFQA
ncbi:hypothetical protein B296_00050773 [Ensete ventricosum]|uniref:Uncharacterized protein n=1 Tax=Ensete ventricosum TaxID=4639 RepID=A0A426XTA1_ENSVE|nr:hypothetical protein B296_00050773 [Ensete ventricosum]